MDYNADNLNWINWVPGGVCVIDPSYQIVAWNDLMEGWTGLKSDDAIGLNLLEMYPHLTSPAFFERLEQVFSTGSPAVYSAGLHRHFLPVQVENAGTTTNMIQQTYVRRVGADRNCVLIYIEDHTRQFSQLKSLHGEMGRRREVENELREHYALQQLITNMQSEYLTTHNSHAFFKSIIERITTFTNSRMGFIAEVVDNKEGRRELAVRACSDQSDCEQTRQFLARYENQKVTFQGYETLFGRIIDEKSSVTAQMPESMPRQGRMPSGHPAIQNFIGLPLIYNQEVIGVVGLANAEEKYPRELEEQL
ncbi:MAG: GAF domain-containing protein, partial [Planctomycetaceae bacterium]|nr:GAF domain-containing protein [Planctomycetaceae bacterium]